MGHYQLECNILRLCFPRKNEPRAAILPDHSPGEVLVRGERIAEVATAVSHPDGAEVIDLIDCTLMPGLIDAHVHLFLHSGSEGMHPQQCLVRLHQVASRG